MAASALTSIFIFAAIFSAVLANDPDPLQDICVADLHSEISVNGFPCKPGSKSTPEDFFFAGLAQAAIANNSNGAVVTFATVTQVPGLNTQGVSMARIDYGPGGLNPPHTHPRATEMIFVLYGELEVGFLTTTNNFFSMNIKAGDNFAFPRGLVHFQKNIDKDKPAAVIAAFNSQFAGTQVIAMTLFGASPPVPDDVLAIAFQISDEEVDEIKSKFAP